MTLVIMAAGMGSRFGGLKQVEPVGPNGEFILDYSIYDAIKAGYDKVVIIIKEENYDLFRQTVGKRIESKVKVEYVFQKITDVPEGVEVPESRVKPWGTSHAILSCKNVVYEPFSVINADDFYGFDPFNKIKKFFDNNKNDVDYSMIGYIVENTMTENGSVKRGVCTKDENSHLTTLIESSIEYKDSKIIATPLEDKNNPFEVSKDTLVSMNFFGFRPNIFNMLEEEMIDFFEKNKDSLDTCEFLIPNSVFKGINAGKINVTVLDTDAVWHGVTYKEDKEDLVTAINDLIEKGNYPKDLWN